MLVLKGVFLGFRELRDGGDLLKFEAELRMVSCGISSTRWLKEAERVRTGPRWFTTCEAVLPHEAGDGCPHLFDLGLFVRA